MLVKQHIYIYILFEYSKVNDELYKIVEDFVKMEDNKYKQIPDCYNKIYEIENNAFDLFMSSM